MHRDRDTGRQWPSAVLRWCRAARAPWVCRLTITRPARQSRRPRVGRPCHHVPQKACPVLAWMKWYGCQCGRPSQSFACLMPVPGEDAFQAHRAPLHCRRGVCSKSPTRKRLTHALQGRMCQLRRRHSWRRPSQQSPSPGAQPSSSSSSARLASPSMRGRRNQRALLPLWPLPRGCWRLGPATGATCGRSGTRQLLGGRLSDRRLVLRGSGGQAWFLGTDMWRDR